MHEGRSKNEEIQNKGGHLSGKMFPVNTTIGETDVCGCAESVATGRISLGAKYPLPAHPPLSAPSYQARDILSQATCLHAITETEYLSKIDREADLLVRV